MLIEIHFFAKKPQKTIAKRDHYMTELSAAHTNYMQIDLLGLIRSASLD
ncbi:MAG: hypothetical protein KBE23_19690 [Chloroflexi bacterium]|nr:hypothetical protein [Chloroflexota bacterium]MBP7044984.1 hypothetical protein [Chloroflexota bacterium]